MFIVLSLVLWLPELRRALGRGKASGTIDGIARAFSATVAARPLLCRLTSIFPSILEHNISTERMVEFKQGLLAVRKQIALDFYTCMPSISAASFERFIHLALPLLIGLWPLSHPSKVAAEVIGLAELVALRYRFQRDLEEGLLMILRSLASE